MIVLTREASGLLRGPDGYLFADGPALPSLVALRYGQRRFTIRPGSPGDEMESNPKEP